MQNIETRVGYVSAEILKRSLTDYIETYTAGGCYFGELRYLQAYDDITKYLDGESGGDAMRSYFETRDQNQENINNR